MRAAVNSPAFSVKGDWLSMDHSNINSAVPALSGLYYLVNKQRDELRDQAGQLLLA